MAIVRAGGRAGEVDVSYGALPGGCIEWTLRPVGRGASGGFESRCAGAPDGRRLSGRIGGSGRIWTAAKSQCCLFTRHWRYVCLELTERTAIAIYIFIEIVRNLLLIH